MSAATPAPRRRKRAPAKAAPGCTFDTVREIASHLPGVEEGTSYGTPSFRVKRTFLWRLWEDGETLVVRIDFETCDFLLEVEPEVFFTTDHYRDYPSLLVRLPRVGWDELESLLEDSWRWAAPKRLVASYAAGSAR